jgi:hypothetical protein
VKGLYILNIINFSFISHPAGGWFKSGKADKNKRRGQKGRSAALSPDSFHLRGSSSSNSRSNPAP